MIKKGIVILITWILIFRICHAQEANSWLFKTQLISSLIYEHSFERLNSYIQDDPSEIISLETSAKIICSYLNLSPIYLSADEKSSSPYIERLIMEGIWEGISTNPLEPISTQEWNQIWERSQEYKNIVQSKVILTNKLSNVYIAEGFEKETEVYYNDNKYNAYLIHNTHFIPIETLVNMGMKIETSNQSIYITKPKDSVSTKLSHEVLDYKIYLSDKSIYIGHVKTIALSIGDNYYVPIKSLNTYYDVHFYDQCFIIEDKVNTVNDFIQIDDDFIINLTDESIELNYRDLFWNGVSIIDKEYNTILLPNEKICKTDKLYGLNSKISYISTVILRMETKTEVLDNLDYCGQNNPYLLNIYSQKIANRNHDNNINDNNIAINDDKNINKNQKDASDQLFPETFIYASLKKDINTLKKGERVEILSAESGKYHIVLDSKSNKHKIPWNSLDIPKEPIPKNTAPTNEEIESYINKQNIDSNTQYLVWTDLYRQRTYIFKGSKNNWKLIKNLLCSTGKNKTPTPKGLYELQAKVPYFGVEKGYMCKNAFQIYGDYLYHSIVFDKTGKRLLEGKGVLGHQASEGCVRFSEEDSLWFYNTMTKGTRVWIR